MFSGSYLAEDVTFLMKVIDLPPTETAEKERLIQNGRRHYSEMISREHPPSTRYLELFHAACRRNNTRLAADLVTLARHIDATIPGPITLVSLARAGTPIGVLLGRILRRHLGRETRHYSISIIRDRGIDEVALRYILNTEKCCPEGIIFVDGWTGKGVIARELSAAMANFNTRHGTGLPTSLVAVADLSGTAGVAATSDDYLIPPSILNAVVSGLVSRSILNRDYIGPNDFHGCLYYRDYQESDLSRSFADQVMRTVGDLPAYCWQAPCRVLSEDEKQLLRGRSEQFITDCRSRFGIRDVNFIKPGIGEATRVLLRRVPERVIVRDAQADDVAHLVHLAREKGVPWMEQPDLPYCAAALIKEMD